MGSISRSERETVVLSGPAIRHEANAMKPRIIIAQVEGSRDTRRRTAPVLIVRVAKSRPNRMKLAVEQALTLALERGRRSMSVASAAKSVLGD
jgi:hypothetical protein